MQVQTAGLSRFLAPEEGATGDIDKLDSLFGDVFAEASKAGEGADVLEDPQLVGDEDVAEETPLEDGEEEEGEEEQESDEDLRQQIASLRAQLEGKQTETSEEKLPEIPKAEIPKLSDDFMSDEEFEEARDSKKGMIALFNRAYQRAIQDAQSQIEPLVDAKLVRTLMAQKIEQEFFRENKDLDTEPRKALLMRVGYEVRQANPGMGPKQLLLEAAKKTRELLGLKAGEIEKRKARMKKEQQRAPVIPGGVGRGNGQGSAAAKKSTTQRVNDAVLDSLLKLNE